MVILLENYYLYTSNTNTRPLLIFQLVILLVGSFGLWLVEGPKIVEEVTRMWEGRDVTRNWDGHNQTPPQARVKLVPQSFYCVYCGMTIPNYAIYCRHCGKRQ